MPKPARQQGRNIQRNKHANARASARAKYSTKQTFPSPRLSKGAILNVNIKKPVRHTPVCALAKTLNTHRVSSLAVLCCVPDIALAYAQASATGSMLRSGYRPCLRAGFGNGQYAAFRISPLLTRRLRQRRIICCFLVA